MLCGEGGTFCAGADLKAVGTERGNRVAAGRRRADGPDPDAARQAGDRRGRGLRGGGGLELALWCDLRVAEEDAVFGVFCRRWGVPLIDGGTVRLPRLIGAGRALDMILTGRAVDARGGAAPWGSPTAWSPPGTARAAAEELAAGARRASRRPACAATARSLLDQEGLTEEAALAVELAHGRQVSLAANTAAGAARFAAGAGRHGSFGP